MYENVTKETARQRAIRIWHNNWIQQNAKAPDDIDDSYSVKALYEERLMNKLRTKLAKEILKIFNKRNRTIIENYKISIQARKRRLLTEKLRRLQASESNGK
jgi:hypothetical protein